VLIARRDGLDEASLPTGLRARTGLPGPLDVRLGCTMTQSRLTPGFEAHASSWLLRLRAQLCHVAPRLSVDIEDGPQADPLSSSDNLGCW
jgi:hypothetical protein